MTKGPNMDTDASKLDEWRAVEAQVLARKQQPDHSTARAAHEYAQYRRLVRGDVRPSAEPEPEAAALDGWRWECAHQENDHLELCSTAWWAAAIKSYRRLACENAQPPAEPDRQTDEALNRAMMLSHTIVEMLPPSTTPVSLVVGDAEPDQDDADTRAVLAAWQSPASSLGDFARAKAALITIKARVRDEAREAVCKWLRDQAETAGPNGWLMRSLAQDFERGEHRLVCEDSRP